jgi:hypothetical protein
MRVLKTVIGAALTLAVFASPAAARQIDPELLMKWSLAEVIHYDVVAEYSHLTEILTGGSVGQWRKVAVKDRFEISFDVSPATATFLGKPVFKNLPSTVSKVFEGTPCQPPKVDGPYEHLEVIDVKTGLGQLELTAKRVYPAGASPYPYRGDRAGLTEKNACSLEAIAAKTVTVTHVIPAIAGKFLVMADLAPKHIRIGEKVSETSEVKIGNDQKTIVVDDTAENGWKYTYTIRIVK